MAEVVVLILIAPPGSPYVAGDKVALSEAEQVRLDDWLMRGFVQPLVRTSEGWESVTITPKQAEQVASAPRPGIPEKKGHGQGAQLLDPLDDVRLKELTNEDAGLPPSDE